ncbi:hypothetical protein MASR2M15_07180 [Anaerolineales bacterium]
MQKDDKSIDWNDVLQQLNWNQADNQARILEQRAKSYAQQAKSTEETAHIRSYITLVLGNERYGIDVMVVQQVRAIGNISPVPGTPDFYLGVTNIRGKILSVLDLKRFLGMAAEEQTGKELLVIRTQALELGIIADEIEDVISLSPAEILAVDLPYALGLTASSITILDMAMIIRDKRLIVGGEFKL